MLRQPDFIPEPVAAVEKEKPKELFKATLGFDFIFTLDNDGALHCFCVEINGHDSGVTGIQDIPRGEIDESYRTAAGIRATYTPEMVRRYTLANTILSEMRKGEFDIFSNDGNSNPEDTKEKVRGYILKGLRAHPTFKYAHRNPDFIESLTRDKRLQEKYIPKEFSPRFWHPGQSVISSTGRWILKPSTDRGGAGVKILSNQDFYDLVKYQTEGIEKYVVQELLESAGAQTVPDSISNRAASMRLLIDFQYLHDGTIVPSFMTAYQRVSPHNLDARHDSAGKLLTKEDLLVVNKHLGAESAAASEEELILAQEVAEKIINNIAQAYRVHQEESSVPTQTT